ncbi:MAG TPA: SGNH/GDSL hydrolase family protein [Gemmatales bacterium]|nr:SGNH/GDSL hydrolase family protein [Gemmatales bacterium]
MSMPRARPTLLRKLLLASVTTLLMLGLLELGFRTYDWAWRGLEFWWDPAYSAQQRTQLGNPLLLFRGAVTDWASRMKAPEQVIDPRGRRVLRIVCVGGSTTQDATAFWEAQITYPSYLEKLLNKELGSTSDVVVEVINAGFASHSTLHMLTLLHTELLQLKPDLIIAYENINDLVVNYFPGPTTPAYANKFLDPYYLPPELTTERTTLLDHSRLYTWARNSIRRVATYHIRYTDAELPLPHRGQYQDNLRHLATLARLHGCEVVFGLQAMAPTPEHFERHFKTKSFNPKVQYPRIGQLQRHFESYHAAMNEVAQEMNIPVANPYRRLVDKPEWFADVVHVQAAGARVVAEEFAATLQQSGVWARLRARAEAGVVAGR